MEWIKENETGFYRLINGLLAGLLAGFIVGIVIGVITWFILLLNAEGEAKAFKQKLYEFRAGQAPLVTKQWMYLQSMTRVLGRVDKVILEGEGLMDDTVKLLPLTDLLSGDKPASSGGK